MFYVYILYSEKFDSFYIGQTNNLTKRILRHNKGYVRSTKTKRPWVVCYSECYDSRAHAMSREAQLKAWKSKSKIRELVDVSRF